MMKVEISKMSSHEQGVPPFPSLFAAQKTDPQPPLVLLNAKKRGRKPLAPEDKLRRECWAIHVGSNVKSATCPFCGVHTITNNVDAAWQSMHIVPSVWCEEQTAYNLVPGCASCNNNMGTVNALDYLWDNFRVDALKRVCMNVYEAFAQRNAEHIHEFNETVWKVVRHLFGHDAYPAGGGITCMNEESIYNVLRLHELERRNANMIRLMGELESERKRSESLTLDIFRPTKRARPFA
jgi:hypothetical protein